MKSAAVLVCAIALAGAGCKRDKDRSRPTAGPDDAAVAPVDARPYHIVLTNVSIETVDPKTPVDVHIRELTEAVASKLTKSAHFAHEVGAAPADTRPRPASLTMVITYDVAATTLSVDIESTLTWDYADDVLIPTQNVAAERAFDGVDPSGAVASFVAEVVARSADALIAKEAIRTGPAASIVAAIRSVDPEMVRWALEVARERPVAEAFDTVIALLASPDRELHAMAIDTLAAIGDRRAIDPIAESVEFTDHQLLEVVIDAVAELGGEGAHVYLEFVASGHPDDDIRERAERALAAQRGESK